MHLPFQYYFMYIAPMCSLVLVITMFPSCIALSTENTWFPCNQQTASATERTDNVKLILIAFTQTFNHEKFFFSLAKYPKLYFAFVGLGAIVNLKFRILNTYYILYRTNVKYCTSNSENFLQSQLFKSKVLKLLEILFAKHNRKQK